MFEKLRLYSINELYIADIGEVIGEAHSTYRNAIKTEGSIIIKKTKKKIIDFYSKKHYYYQEVFSHSEFKEFYGEDAYHYNIIGEYIIMNKRILLPYLTDNEKLKGKISLKRLLEIYSIINNTNMNDKNPSVNRGRVLSIIKK